MALFRFQDLEIWKEAISIASVLFRIADELEQKKLWRFADQLRGVGMSISNNIAESTANNMQKEQQQLLRYSRRECYEAANILTILEMENLILREINNTVCNRLAILSRRISSYSKAL